jgi:hypothetical protein
MSYNPRRPLHTAITTIVMTLLGLVIASYDGTWLLIVPILVTTLSAGSVAGLFVAIVIHLVHILQFGFTVSGVSMMVIDVFIVAIIMMIYNRMRIYYIYTHTSLYPVAIMFVFVRSCLIVLGMWMQSLFVPQTSATTPPIDVLTQMLFGPAILMTVSAMVGVIVINMLLRTFLP